MEPVPYAKLGDPQSLNLYAYVGNNPLDGVDADGHYGPEFAIPDSSWVSDDPGTQEQKAKEAAARQQAQRQQAQQHAGRQPDGSYRADLSSPEIAPLLDPNHKPSKSDVVGNGECVTFCKRAAGLEDTITSQWIPGPKVAGNDIARGTAIATLGSGGYPQEDGVAKNSAIYLGKGTNGSIWILDQYNHPAHPPHPREIFFNSNPNHDVSNNANSYYVIHVR
ncbi:MAG TPA: BPSL0067 family protein [Nitrospira sp.]|nr:BPSL0067 family protein [Nitrospira sp.]